MKKLNKSFIGVGILMLLEVFELVFLFYITYLIRSLLNTWFKIPVFAGNHYAPFSVFLAYNFWIILIYFSIFWFQGLYSKYQTFWYEWIKIIKSVIVAVILSFTFVTIFQTQGYASRLFIIIYGLLIALILPLVRYILKIVLLKLGLWGRSYIFIGSDKMFKELSHILSVNRYLGIILKCQLDSPSGNAFKSFKTLNRLVKGIIKKINDVHANGVIIETSYLGDANVELLAELLQYDNVDVLLFPLHMGYKVQGADTYHLMYENYFLIRLPRGLFNPFAQFIKRIIDMVLGLLALILLSPLLILAGLFTYIGDGFPIIYESLRYGYKGKLFKFLKFRYMRKDTSANPKLEQKILDKLFEKRPDLKQMWKEYKKLPVNDDPRIIPKTGRLMAKLDLPELAQIINVLKGDMSLVGPRPYLPREREDMGDYFWRVTSVKPGITGLWQVLGGNKRSFKERLQIDTWYIRNWTIWLDIVIMLKTIQLVLKAIFDKLLKNKDEGND